MSDEPTMLSATSAEQPRPVSPSTAVHDGVDADAATSDAATDVVLDADGDVDAARAVDASTAGDGGLDRDRIPPDPATLITALAEALADLHLGRISPALAPVGVGLHTLDHRSAAEMVAVAVADGWAPPDESPYFRAGAARLSKVVADGVERFQARSNSLEPAIPLLCSTIGRATFANLALAVPSPDSELSTSPNLTFRRSRSVASERSRFVVWDDAASSDPYRDLAIAAADVIATFGAGAVLGFVAAYATANPGIEPIDPIRLDWWSMVTTVLGASASPDPSTPDGSFGPDGSGGPDGS